MHQNDALRLIEATEPPLRNRYLVGLIALLIVSCSEPGPQLLPGDQLIIDTTVVDVAANELLPSMTVIVRDDRILAVLPSDQVNVTNEDLVIATGGYVMPGLWDMHVHALGNSDDAISRVLPLFLANGVTGIRDMGSVVDGVAAVRKRLANEPGLVAPAIVAAGPILDGVKLPWYGDLPLVIDSVDAVEAALTNLLEQGLDFFKVYDQLSQPVYDAIAAYANENDIAFAGHSVRSVGMQRAAAAGQRSIEHLSLFSLGDCAAETDGWYERALGAKFGEGGYAAYYDVVIEFFESFDETGCEQAIATMVENSTFFTPTLVMELNDRSRVDESTFQYMAPGAIEWCENGLAAVEAAASPEQEAVFDLHLSFAKRLHDAGVLLLAGSDNPNYCLVPGFSLHWELSLLVEAGLTPAEALQTATINAASALGKEGEEGKVAPAYRANLVMLDANPLDDISNARQVTGVIAGGRWLGRDALDSMLQSAGGEAGEAL